PTQLNRELRAAWSKHCANRISKGRRIPLTGQLATYVANFDFSCVTYKPILEIIGEHATTVYAAQRFGGGMRAPYPDDQEPPSTPAHDETRYVERLLEAYTSRVGGEPMTVQALATHAELRADFQRQRIRFYSAETLKVFARDHLAPGLQKGMTFEG